VTIRHIPKVFGQKIRLIQARPPVVSLLPSMEYRKDSNHVRSLITRMHAIRKQNISIR
jgi:hypothetical protein